MPAKKTVTAEAKAEKETVKKPAAKKATTKKTATKKATEDKEVKATAKKETTTKKVAAKKTTTKKATTAKKPAAKKTTKKVVKEETPVVNKKTVKDYEDVINWKKGEAHAMDWLYIEVNAGDLLTEVEAGVDNLAATCEAILNCMLEGDGFIVEPTEADKVNASLTVRYYCDNLSEDRKKYFER